MNENLQTLLEVLGIYVPRLQEDLSAHLEVGVRTRFGETLTLINGDSIQFLYSISQSLDPLPYERPS